MFNDGFYPTSSAVAFEMVHPLKELIHGGAVICDPEGGKGDLLDAAVQVFEGDNARYSLKYAKNQYLAIEIENDLRAILREKGYQVVGEDFLQYSTNRLIDVFVMNPPFAAGAAHLLHAWDVLKAGHIVCLLNSETIRNPHTRERQLLRDLIAREGGTVEHIGQRFAGADAERKTKVEVCIVRLQKKADPGSEFYFDVSDEGATTPNLEDGMNEAALIRGGSVEGMVDLYRAATIIGAEWARAQRKLMRAIEPFMRQDEYASGRDVSELLKNCTPEAVSASPVSVYNSFVTRMQSAAWDAVLRSPKLNASLTSQARARFEAFKNEQRGIEFNEKNIYALIHLLFSQREKLMTECVLEVFDLMCRYDENNRIHFEGWKTNDRWRVNKKVILPYYVDYWKESRTMHASVHRHDELVDIDRAMCHLAGVPLGNIYTLYESMRDRFSRVSGPCEGESSFFRWKAFLKGTLHIWFLDEALWEKFNIEAARGKGWLPEAGDSSARPKPKRGGTGGGRRSKADNAPTMFDDVDEDDVEIVQE